MERISYKHVGWFLVCFGVVTWASAKHGNELYVACFLIGIVAAAPFIRVAYRLGLCLYSGRVRELEAMAGTALRNMQSENEKLIKLVEKYEEEEIKNFIKKTK